MKVITDEWGVTYSADGRVLKKVDPELFTCEEYTIPEGVVEMEGGFFFKDLKLRIVHLPSTLRKMEANAFILCPLEEIALPEGLTEVPEFMCECCKELKKVDLPSTINIIRAGAFNCCKRLSEINLPDTIEWIEQGAFRYCDSLVGEFLLPPKINGISPEMFYCSGIEAIDIHKNIAEIGYYAFWGCKHLKRLVIPDWVKDIDHGLVSAHEGFEGVECHAKGYHVENDALICDKNHVLLCCWTQQKHYVVPESVKRIADFSGNEYVETITVKQPVQLTTYDTFASNLNLQHVDFQGGVTGVKEYTFWNCPKISKD